MFSYSSLPIESAQGRRKYKLFEIAPGELRSNERLGQEPKTGAQAKPGQGSAGMSQIQGAARGAWSFYITLAATPKPGKKRSKTG
jgi:hypothetical protein